MDVSRKGWACSRGLLLDNHRNRQLGVKLKESGVEKMKVIKVKWKEEEGSGTK